MLRFIGLTTALLIAASAVGQTGFISADKIQRFEELVHARMISQNVPGVSLVVIDSGEVVYQRGFGWASGIGQEPRLEMQTDTPTALGSLSKSFTAVAIMQQVDAGQIGLDDAVAKYLTELRAPDDQRIANITIRQLLNHTSGFSTYAGNFGQAEYHERSDALERAAHRLAATALQGNPGASFEYSNANYQLLGLLLERLQNHPFEQIIQTQVLDLLQLHNSFVRKPRKADTIVAVGHRYWLDQPVAFNKPLPRTVVAQGGIYASAADVGSYLLDLMSKEPVLLSSSARDQLFQITHQDAGADYGLGWFVESHPSGQLIFHGGLNPGYEVEAGFIPKLGSGYVVLANAGSGYIAGNVGAIIGSVRQVLLDGDVPDTALPSVNRWAFGALSLLTLGLFLLCVRWSAYLVLGLPQILKRTLGVTGLLLRVLVPAVLLSMLAALLLWYVPMLSGIPLPGLQAFAPDIGLLLLFGGLLSLLLAMLRSFALVRG